MPLTMEVDKTRRLIIKTAEGDISFSNVEESCELMFSNPDYDPSFELLWDVSRATFVETQQRSSRLLGSEALGAE